MVFGVAHRGRLNFIAQVMQEPLETLFQQFSGRHVQIRQACLLMSC